MKFCRPFLRPDLWNAVFLLGVFLTQGTLLPAQPYVGLDGQPLPSTLNPATNLAPSSPPPGAPSGIPSGNPQPYLPAALAPATAGSPALPGAPASTPITPLADSSEALWPRQAPQNLLSPNTQSPPTTAPAPFSSDSAQAPPPARADQNSAGVIPAAPDTSLQSSPTIATWGEFVNAQIIARVGNETILAADVLGPVNKTLEQYKNQMSASEYADQQQRLMREFVKQLIEVKIIFADAMTHIPRENIEKMRGAVNEQFETSHVKRLQEVHKAANRTELEQKLLASGSSLDKQQRMFFERSVAVQWERQNIKEVSEIPLSEVLADYRNHLADYEIKATVRWEHLMISFAKVSDKNAAYGQLANLGNSVLQGASFAAVAEKSSHGPTAYKQGQWDWTTRGSLKSKVLNEALFAIPVGQLSAILEDEDGFHIIRVLERKDDGRVPFETAQVEIREKLLREAEEKSRLAYLDKVRERVPVWTIFDGQIDPAEIKFSSNAPPERKKKK
ncbi:MAG: peptidylprolyl isomerase [Pirellulales bacterium]|nr:peptidylprolyl isomerase [Pirellulales bacterium]